MTANSVIRLGRGIIRIEARMPSQHIARWAMKNGGRSIPGDHDDLSDKGRAR